MRVFIHLPCVLLLAFQTFAAGGEPPAALKPFLEKHCLECHDAETQKGKLDLSKAGFDLSQPAQMERWLKVNDYIRDGEMPPAKQPRPEAAEIHAALATLAQPLTEANHARHQRDGRTKLRRLNRVEFENTLRDLLSLPGIKVKDTLPADGKSHGFDRSAKALDLSFIHIESYLAAVDKALNEALCPLPDMPPVQRFRYHPWQMVLKDGKESESSFGQAVGEKTAVPLIGLERDNTFTVVKAHIIQDDEPKATAVAFFRHEDADYRTRVTAMLPYLTGWYKLRVSAYSVWWDGQKVQPTDRHGALGWGIFAKNEHYGTVDLPPNKAAVQEIDAWLERGGGMTHGTDDQLRIIAASCENVRDYAHGKNKDVPGPLYPVPGVAVEWVEMEGPFHEMWPPASHRALFGELPVKEWTSEDGAPKPAQQVWPRGNPGTYPKDIYGEHGEKRPIVYVESLDPNQDAGRLLRVFLRHAYRRPVTDEEVAEYAQPVQAAVKEGIAFQDAMISAYRRVLTSPDFLLLREPRGKLDDHALATRLSYFLWSSLPDKELFDLADQGQLGKPEVLRAQTERLLQDPKAARFIENFTGQWLSLREIAATQPDRKLYPEYMPWLQEAMLKETHAFFAELLKNDLGIVNVVQSDFAMLNEPLARLYHIDGVHGWGIRRVSLPPGCKRGGFLTQGAVLKTTANGTTTSPVKRGAFVMDRILGIVPTPPPPDAGVIEPDTRGATTIREQLDKHRRNESCAACHRKMDGYGFALESFDVLGEWRDKYRATGGEGPGETRKKVNGNSIDYHFGLPVDDDGLMPDGHRFVDVNELRQLLAADPERLARAFLGQLIVYATGAEISFSDRPQVESILAKTKDQAYGLRSLLHEVVQSVMFRNK